MNKIISEVLLLASLLTVSYVHPAYAAQVDSAKHSPAAASAGKTAPSSQNKAAWDKSSLAFTGQDQCPDGISATVKNGGSQAMQGEVVYEVFYTEKGNPKKGIPIYSGIIKPLLPGESAELVYHPDRLAPGEYMFKAYQRTGHPGTGELWSSSITVAEHSETQEQLQPERPFDQFFNSSVEGGTATFTVPEGMEMVEISFTSYIYPKGVVPQGGQPYESQIVYDNVTKCYGPGTHTVHVDLPEHGYWQTDLYLGPVIETLTENGHPLDKIIDADSGMIIQ